MNEEELTKKLNAYADFVLSELQNWEKEGRIHRIPTPIYLDRESPEKVVEYSAGVQVIKRDHWDYLESDSFLRYIYGSPIAEVTANAIIQFPPKNPTMNIYLWRFTRAIMDSKIGMVKFKPPILVRDFASSLAGSPLTRYLEAKMHGIEVKNSIRLGKGVVLRPPTSDDSDWKKKGFMEPFDKGGFWGPPDSILESVMRTKLDQDFRDQFYRIFHLMRLYRPKPIGSSHAICYSASSIRGCGPYTTSLPVGGYVNTDPRYAVDDVEDFKGFVKRFLRKLPRDWNYINLEFTNPLNIAYYRYLEALQHYNQRERAITFAVMGLEALILEKGPELKYKFCSRLAKMFSYLNSDSSDVYRILNRAYSIRSNFVHGKVSKPSTIEKRKMESEKQRECLELSLKILQTCILIYLSNGDTLSKKQLMKYIDNAMIGSDKEGEKELHKILKKYKRIRHG